MESAYTSLFYYPSDNHFTDHDGFIIYNIYDYVEPWMLFLFRQAKETMVFEVLPNFFVELLYLYDEDDF